jgi:hypothetical protein
MISKPTQYFLMLLFLFAGKITAQEQRPYDYAAPYKDNQVISQLINLKLYPESNNPDYYTLYESFRIVRSKGKYGIYNESKKIYFRQPVYDSITVAANYLQAKKWKNFLYDNVAVNFWPDNPDGIIFKKRKKYGLKSIDGKLLLEPEYTEIQPLGQKVFRLKKGSKYAFAITGQKLIVVGDSFDYVILKPTQNENLIAAYKDRIETLYNLDGSGFIERKEPQIPTEPYAFTDNYAHVHGFYENGKIGIKDSFEETLVPAIYDAIKQEDYEAYRVSNYTATDTLHGLIHKYGKIILPLRFRKLNILQQKIYEAGDKNKFGLYDNSGKEIYPQAIDSLYPLTMAYVKDHNFTVYLMNQKPGASADLLKIDNGIATVILKDGVNMSCLAENRIYIGTNVIKFQKPGSELIGVIEPISEKIIQPQFKSVFYDTKQKLILAATGNVANVIISPELIIRRAPKKIVGYNNGYFIYTENGKMGAMDRDFRPAKFRYQKLEAFFDTSDDHLLGMTDDKKKMIVGWFRYYTAVGGKKAGIIDYDGKIIIPAGQYDSISLLHYYRQDNGTNRLYQNAKFETFTRGIKLLCEKNIAPDRTVITLRTETAIATSFELADTEKWEFAANNRAIIIRGSDAVRIFDFDKQKNIVELHGGRLAEDYTGGFTHSIKVDDLKNRFTKYSSNGNVIAQTDFGSYDNPQFSNKKNYISVRNGKYGVATVDDEILLPFENDTLFTRDDIYYIGKKASIWFVRNQKNEVLLTDADAIETVHLYSGNSEYHYDYIVERNGKKFAYDRNLKLVPIDGADKLSISGHSLLAKHGALCTAYNMEGKLLFSIECDALYEYSKPYFIFTKNGKNGLIDESGKVILPAEYPQIWPFAKDTYVIENESKKWVINGKGKVLIDDYTTLGKLDSYPEPYIYENPKVFFVATNKAGRTALFNPDKKQVLQYESQEIYEVRELRYVLGKRNGKVGVIDLDGKKSIPFIYDDLYFDPYNRYYFAKKDGKKMLMMPDATIFYEENTP